ncbi:MAG: hypothetical protein QXR76_03370 [Candidatus Bathyarchaeia archaeon]
MRKKTSIFIDAELWRRFKAKCAERERSISNELERLIREACEKP